MKSLLTLVLLVACGGSSGGNGNPDSNTGHDGNGNVDAKIFMDAPPFVPPTITVTGNASRPQLGPSIPQQNVVIGAYKSSDEVTPIATATTDAMGNFTMTITTGGLPVDGFLKATKATFLDTYLYPPAPLIADFAMARVLMLMPVDRDTLSNIARG